MVTLFSDIQIGEQFRVKDPKNTFYTKETVLTRIKPGQAGDARFMNAEYYAHELKESVLVNIRDDEPVAQVRKAPEKDRDVIAVSVEMEPHNENLEGVMLNRPAPSGGAFLIDRRVPEAVWKQMKAAGACYWSADDLEEFDMFFSEPGWRYSLAALAILLHNGYGLALRGETISTPEQLQAMFTEEAKAAYRQHIQAEREQAERVAGESRIAAEREAGRKEAEYQAWQAGRLAGLVKTFANPCEEIHWNALTFFDKDTPGTWYTTGDAWFTALVDGQTVYKRAYGNASVLYAPSEIVDRWCLQAFAARVEKFGESETARNILEMATLYAERDVIGADVAARLVQLVGDDALAEMACRETWFVVERVNGGLEHIRPVVEKYGIPAIELKMIHFYDYNIVSALIHPVAVDHNGRPEKAQQILRSPDGSLYAETYGQNFWRLTAEQIAILPGDLR